MAIVGILIIGGIYLFEALTYKIFYFETTAVCMGAHHHRRGCWDTWYKYYVDDEEYIRIGLSYIRPINGKTYRVFVRENDNNKVAGYNYFVFMLTMGLLHIAFCIVAVALMAFL